MIPTEVLSDLDIDEIDRAELTGRWSVLVDLVGEFQGAYGAYFVLGLLVPGMFIVFVSYSQRQLGRVDELTQV